MEKNACEISGAAEIILRKSGNEPYDLAIVLGSGLGLLTERIDRRISFHYGELPGLPAPTVAGHSGLLVAGHLQGWRVLVFAGRYHLYEGYDARQVTIQVHLARELGCRRLLLTNAAGGISGEFVPGDFMFVRDHLNLTGDNPLRGLSNAFVNLNGLYRHDLFPPLLAEAQTAGIRLHEGILAALPGPSYETPAEVRALRILGADAVSMSTVPEAILARYLGMEVVALSMIANCAAGLSTHPPEHGEVLEAGRRASRSLAELVCRLVPIWKTVQAPG